MVVASEKGAEWEREAGKQLSLWITGGSDNSQFMRSRASGAWKTGINGPEGWRHNGDLAPNGPLGDEFRKRFVVECKHQKGIDLWNILSAPKAEWLTWVPRIEAECLKWNLCPWLMIKPNARGVYVWAPASMFRYADIQPQIILNFGDHCNWRYGIVPWKLVQTVPVEEWYDVVNQMGLGLNLRP